MNADDLKNRTKRFALRILRLAAALPNTIEGKAIKGQLVRAGTSVGANYRAVLALEQSSFQRLARLKRNQTKAPFGWKSL